MPAPFQALAIPTHYIHPPTHYWRCQGRAEPSHKGRRSRAKATLGSRGLRGSSSSARRPPIPSGHGLIPEQFRLPPSVPRDRREEKSRSASLVPEPNLLPAAGARPHVLAARRGAAAGAAVAGGWEDGRAEGRFQARAVAMESLTQTTPTRPRLRLFFRSSGLKPRLRSARQSPSPANPGSRRAQPSGQPWPEKAERAGRASRGSRPVAHWVL